MEKQLSTIIDILSNIEERLDKIESNIIVLNEGTKVVEKDCSKMREHIDFVEHTYDAIKMPLTYVKNKIEYMMRIEPVGMLVIDEQ